METTKAKGSGRFLNYLNQTARRMWKTKFLFALFLPTLLYLILFKYIPMWGLCLSFYKYNIFGGLSKSKFIGLDNFRKFFNSPDAWSVTRNTLILGGMSLFITFPITVVFALLLNEVRSTGLKRVTQTVSYLPHFLSVVVVCGLTTTLLDPVSGGINMLIKLFGGSPINFMTKTSMYRGIYIISEIWQGLGWSTIVFIAAISGVDPGLYEAARMDGAGRFRQMWNITIPSIMPQITTMFILKVGHVMDASLEKALLLSQPATYEVSQVISSYVYWQGFGRSGSDFGYAAAVGLYQNLINLVLLLAADRVSKRLTDNGIF